MIIGVPRSQPTDSLFMELKLLKPMYINKYLIWHLGPIPETTRSLLTTRSGQLFLANSRFLDPIRFYEPSCWDHFLVLLSFVWSQALHPLVIKNCHWFIRPTAHKLMGISCPFPPILCFRLRTQIQCTYASFIRMWLWLAVVNAILDNIMYHIIDDCYVQWTWLKQGAIKRFLNLNLNK